MQIIANNWAIHKGASKLARSKGFASNKKYAELGETPVLPGRRILAAASKNVARSSTPQ